MKINAKDIKDREFAKEILAKAANIYQKTCQLELEMMAVINEKLDL